jgi:hypothetical protein
VAPTSPSSDEPRLSGIRRLFSALAVVLFTGTAVLVTPPPVGAETPTEVLAELVGDNTYVAADRQGEFDETEFERLVVDARALGVNLVIIAPFEVSPTTTAFARRVREASGVGVVVVFGPDGVFAVNVEEDLEDDATRAVNVASDVADPIERVETLITELTTEPVRERPAFFDRVLRWVITLLLVLIGAAVVERLVRQGKKARRRAKLRETVS